MYKSCILHYTSLWEQMLNLHISDRSSNGIQTKPQTFPGTAALNISELPGNAYGDLISTCSCLGGERRFSSAGLKSHDHHHCSTSDTISLSSTWTHFVFDATRLLEKTPRPMSPNDITAHKLLPPKNPVPAHSTTAGLCIHLAPSPSFPMSTTERLVPGPQDSDTFSSPMGRCFPQIHHSQDGQGRTGFSFGTTLNQDLVLLSNDLKKADAETTPLFRLFPLSPHPFMGLMAGWEGKYCPFYTLASS